MMMSRQDLQWLAHPVKWRVMRCTKMVAMERMKMAMMDLAKSKCQARVRVAPLE